MKITANGICQFHFWGTYSQSFYLHFETAEDAALALPILRRLVLPSSSKNWMSTGRSLGIFATGDDVALVEAQLVALGADPDKMGSMAHSCDSGEPFSVTLHVDDPAQVLLLV